MPLTRKPRLGQNFLIDDQARQNISQALGETQSRTVIEIGPGHGAITDYLVPRCRRLILIEIDPSLAAELRFRFRASASVEVIEADVLTVDFAALLSEGETADIVGNLPYYITSDILLHLFASASRLRRAVLMMQREVADRVAADPGRRDYGLLSATTQLYARVENLFTLPPEAFSPPPDVFSTVVRLEFAPRFSELRIDPTGFDVFLHHLFAQKRKTVRNNLRSAGWSILEIEAVWPAKLPAAARAESLTLAETAALYHALGQQRQV